MSPSTRNCLFSIGCIILSLNSSATPGPVEVTAEVVPARTPPGDYTFIPLTEGFSKAGLSLKTLRVKDDEIVVRGLVHQKLAFHLVITELKNGLQLSFCQSFVDNRELKFAFLQHGRHVLLNIERRVADPGPGDLPLTGDLGVRKRPPTIEALNVFCVKGPSGGAMFLTPTEFAKLFGGKEGAQLRTAIIDMQDIVSIANEVLEQE